MEAQVLVESLQNYLKYLMNCAKDITLPRPYLSSSSRSSSVMPTKQSQNVA